MHDANAAPILASTHDLKQWAQRGDVAIVDLQSAEHFAHAHIPGARNLDYAHLIRSDGRAGGLLPPAEEFGATVRSLGVDIDQQVVAYDAEGGAAAARLVWNLHVFGHRRASLLDGGLHAWAADGGQLATGPMNAPSPGNFEVTSREDLDIEFDELLDGLNNERYTVVDARSLDEHTGRKAFAARAGRIPGAVHFEWTTALDPNREFRMRPAEELLELLSSRGIERQDELVVHCQTHRRSSYSYVMLKHLGFEHVRCYAGSWSEWGNRNDSPIETGPAKS